MWTVWLFESHIGCKRPPPIFALVKVLSSCSSVFINSSLQKILPDEIVLNFFPAGTGASGLQPKASFEDWRLQQVSAFFSLNILSSSHYVNYDFVIHILIKWQRHRVLMKSCRKIFPILYGMFVFYFFVRYYAIEGALSIEYWHFPFHSMQPFLSISIHVIHL